MYKEGPPCRLSLAKLLRWQRQPAKLVVEDLSPSDQTQPVANLPSEFVVKLHSAVCVYMPDIRHVANVGG